MLLNLVDKVRYFRQPEGVATGGGQQQQQSTVPGGQDTTAGGDNADANQKDYLDTLGDLWDTGKGNDPDPVADANRQAALDAKAKATNENLDNYVKTLDFGIKFDETKLLGEDGKLDHNYVQSVLVGSQQQMFRKVLTDVASITREMEGRLRKDMDAAAQTRLRASKAEDSLIEAVPIAAKAAVRPVALAVKAQLIKAGKSDEEANAGVKKFLQEMGAAVQDDNEPGKPPNSRPGMRANGTRDQDTPQDWGKILRGEV